MTTKEKLLQLLEAEQGRWLSGEEIAERLGVSRTAVWKAVNGLRSDGYTIEAAQNKGYCLSEHMDLLSPERVRSFLKPEYRDLEIEVMPMAASTNASVRDKANEGYPEGYAVIANAQSQGRGRLGRQFFSPPDTGIYLSLLLRPMGFTPRQAVRVTTMAAVAACRAIDTAAGVKTQIKWVNDILLNGKKVGGILTEGAFNLENGCMDYIVLGIGINVYPPREGFPAQIGGTAGTVYSDRVKDGKNRIAAGFLNAFMEIYRSADPAEYSGEYRERSVVIGREITVYTQGEQRSATALDVDKDCCLIVRYGDGSIDHLSSAEVSVRVE